MGAPFGARNNVVKQQCHIPGHKIPSPFKAQCDGGFQLALFRVEALIAVQLHVEKLNILPGLGALLGTGRSGSPVPLWGRTDLIRQQVDNQSWWAIEVL